MTKEQIDLVNEMVMLKMTNKLLKTILADALGSFKCTQKPKDYPKEHWSNMAEKALRQIKE